MCFFPLLVCHLDYLLITVFLVILTDFHDEWNILSLSLCKKSEGQKCQFLFSSECKNRSFFSLSTIASIIPLRRNLFFFSCKHAPPGFLDKVRTLRHSTRQICSCISQSHPALGFDILGHSKADDIHLILVMFCCILFLSCPEFPNCKQIYFKITNQWRK